MAKKYLDDTGMSYFWGKLKAYFQPTLVSGTNIKTINNESLLGSGDISVASPLKQTSVSGTTDGNGNLKLSQSGIAMRAVIFVWDNSKVFIPFYFNNVWYARVQLSNAAGSALTNTAITCNILYM